MKIEGVEFTRLKAHADERGSFVEILRAAGHPHFAQANHSRSKKGVLRGLHYHRKQADLWYVVSGKARVGLADLRRPSDRPATATVELSGDDPSTLFIPPGVAHGFMALTDVDLIYFVTHEYDASDEYGVAWDDPTLAIPWGADSPTLSERDSTNPSLEWEQIPQFS